MEELFYITRVRIPTEKAHGLQIVKMCEAYSMCGKKVTLVIPKRKNSIKETLEEYYKINKSFNIRYIATYVLITNRRFIGRFLFWGESVIFIIKVLGLQINTKALIITRSIEVAYILNMVGRKTILEVHDIPKSLSKLYIFLLRKIKYIVCTSQGLKSKLTEFGISNVLVAPNAIDESFLHLNQNRVITKDSCGIPNNKIILMYIGSLASWKGVETLLAAVTLLPTHFAVVIAGGTSEEVFGLKIKHPQVIFLGSTPTYLLPEYQQLADILIIPNNPREAVSSIYTSPIKLFAHLTSKKPILVTDMPSIREVVSEREVYFFNGSTEDLVKKCSSIMSDTHEIKTRVANAYELVASNTWKNRAHKILDFAK